MPGVNYTTTTMGLRAQVRDLTGGDPVDYIARPGGGDPPKWHFVGGYVARGGHAAEAYLRGVLAGIAAMEGFHVESH